MPDNDVVTRPTPPRRNSRATTITATGALVVAVVALFIALSPDQRSSTRVSPDESKLRDIERTKTLRVGYEGYPPYVIEDPTTGNMSGYSVDLAEYIAERAGWAVEWVKSSPDTKIPDLQAGRFDVMVEPIFRTIPRAARVTFTRPYAYFGYAAAIVQEGDTRFSSIADLNEPGVTVAVRQGYTDEAYAQENLPLARVRALNVDDISQVFLEVTTGSADVALADLSQARAYHNNHENAVDLLFSNPPPAFVPAGFMIRAGDFRLYNFLNVAIDYVEANGVLAQLDAKWNVDALSSLPEPSNSQ